MSEVTDVDIVSGIPTGGTGTVPTLSKTNTLAGAVTETAPATDTASSGLNGRLQRIAQRITSMIALLPAALGSGGGLKVDGSGTALPVSHASGSVASGAFASGSIASGAVASGAVASGAYASGSIADGAMVTLGAKADAKSTATDTTATTAMQVWKQISASVQLWVYGGGTQAAAARVTLATDSPGIIATVAHDAVDSGDPLKIGYRALAHGTNPTAVAAGDRSDALCNRAGIPWVIGGHPNVITRSHIIAASDGAQTDAALLTISAGSKIVITQISVVMDAANTVNVAAKIGFGTATIAAASLAGTVAIVLHGTYGAGTGQQKGNGAGIVAIGADNEDLRVTSGSPTGGNIYITYSYYTIES